MYLSLLRLSLAIMMAAPQSSNNVSEPETSAVAQLPCSEFLEDADMLATKWYTVLVLGTTISVLSISFNLFLLCVFVCERSVRRTHFYYFTWIAAFDIFIGINYILIFSVKVLMQYYTVSMLYKLWFFYVVPIFTLSNIVLTTSAFLILMATLERFTMLVERLGWLHRRMVAGRHWGATLAFLIGLVSKGSIIAELETRYQGHCEFFQRYDLRLSPLAREKLYNKFVRFYLRNALTVLLPFIVLLTTNAYILYAMRVRRQQARRGIVNEGLLARVNKHSNDALLRRAVINQTVRAEANAATWTLVATITTYLLANALNFAVTVAEFSDVVGAVRILYSYSADTSSILAVAAGLSRLPVFISINEHIRRASTRRARRVCSLVLCCLPAAVQPTRRPLTTSVVSRADPRQSVVGCGLDPGLEIQVAPDPNFRRSVIPNSLLLPVTVTCHQLVTTPQPHCTLVSDGEEFSFMKKNVATRIRSHDAYAKHRDGIRIYLNDMTTCESAKDARPSGRLRAHSSSANGFHSSMTSRMSGIKSQSSTQDEDT